MAKFNGIEIIKVETPSIPFSAIHSFSLEETPEEIQNLEHGFYSVGGQEFKIVKKEFSNSIYFPWDLKLQGKHVIEKWIEDKWEREHIEEEERKKAEMDAWNADVDNDLFFDEEGEAHLKSWKGKSIHVIKQECEYEGTEAEFHVFVDGRPYCDLLATKDKNGNLQYDCFDGEPYGTKSKPKRAIENMLKSCFPNRNDDDSEPSCSACGDGGCIHCEPHRFIDGYIY